MEDIKFNETVTRELKKVAANFKTYCEFYAKYMNGGGRGWKIEGASKDIEKRQNEAILFAYFAVAGSPDKDMRFGTNSDFVSEDDLFNIYQFLQVVTATKKFVELGVMSEVEGTYDQFGFPVHTISEDQIKRMKKICGEGIM